MTTPSRMTDATQTTSGFRVFWSSEDQQWVATSDAFPSLSHLAGTPDGALRGMIALHRSAAPRDVSYP